MPDFAGAAVDRDVQDWLDIPEHMLQINSSAFVPSIGGKKLINHKYHTFYLLTTLFYLI